MVESLTKHQKKALLAVLNHKVVFANWAWEVTDISVAGMEECITCISYHGVMLSFSALDSTSLQYSYRVILIDFIGVFLGFSLAQTFSKKKGIQTISPGLPCLRKQWLIIT